MLRPDRTVRRLPNGRRRTGMAQPYRAFSADCAAARRAIGTRNGEQDT